MTPRVLAVIGLGAAAALLGGCAHADPTPAATATPATLTGAPAATLPPALTVVATPRSAGPSCELMSAQDAASKWLAQVPSPDGTDVMWQLTPEGAAGYDPCADLSWMVVDVPGGGATSPRQIMLFHHGEYVGTASRHPYVGDIAVTRTAAGALALGYHAGGAGHGADAPQATATIAWDEAARAVSYAG